MKALDCFLIVCVIVLLGVAYYVNTVGNAELAVLINFCAIVCGVAFGSRLGGRQYKKNQENK
ncbi:MAG: hypothetical protein K6D91_04125 [Prevotella sp.]|nr:hypothetical protein [Prevotella sp.]